MSHVVRMRRHWRRTFGLRERGSALVEFITLGLVLLLPLIYLTMTVFAVQRSAYAASAATRAGGRAYVLVGSQGGDAAAALSSAAHRALADQDVDGWGSVSGPSCSGGCLQPGSSVTVSVDVDVPLPLPSFMSGWAPTVMRVHSSHTTPFGDYRAIR